MPPLFSSPMTVSSARKEHLNSFELKSTIEKYTIDTLTDPNQLILGAEHEEAKEEGTSSNQVEEPRISRLLECLLVSHLLFAIT